MDMMNKGQEQSLDLIFAMGTFIVALLLITSTWLMIGNRVNSAVDRTNIGDAAFYAAEALVTTPGNPINWHEQNNMTGVNAIGLADYRNVINSDKLEKLQALINDNSTGDSAKEALGLGRYSVNIDVEQINGTKLYSFGDAFNETDETTTNLIVQRMAILNGSIVRMKVSVWE